jgi:hypothetical protein
VLNQSYKLAVMLLAMTSMSTQQLNITVKWVTFCVERLHMSALCRESGLGRHQRANVSCQHYECNNLKAVDLSTMSITKNTPLLYPQPVTITQIIMSTAIRKSVSIYTNIFKHNFCCIDNKMFPKCAC